MYSIQLKVVGSTFQLPALFHPWNCTLQSLAIKAESGAVEWCAPGPSLASVPPSVFSKIKTQALRSWTIFESCAECKRNAWSLPSLPAFFLPIFVTFDPQGLPFLFACWNVTQLQPVLSWQTGRQSWIQCVLRCRLDDSTNTQRTPKVIPNNAGRYFKHHFQVFSGPEVLCGADL